MLGTEWKSLRDADKVKGGTQPSTISPKTVVSAEARAAAEAAADRAAEQLLAEEGATETSKAGAGKKKKEKKKGGNCHTSAAPAIAAPDPKPFAAPPSAA